MDKDIDRKVYRTLIKYNPIENNFKFDKIENRIDRISIFRFSIQ